MNWEETIKFIRTQPDYAELVEKAYLDERLQLNVDRYITSEEWKEILSIIKKHAPNVKNVIDVGSGNGISAIAFALIGYKVTIIEPDPSETIGAGAIRKLKTQNQLTNITIIESFAEDVIFKDVQFDLVFCRQSMHHANDLNSFVSSISRYLKPGGLFLSVRDHVIFNTIDKKRFLKNHPLQKFYGGENAFKPSDYQLAIKKAGLTLVNQLKYYDSIINYFPTSTQEVISKKEIREGLIRKISQRIPVLPAWFVYPIIKMLYNLRIGSVYDEKKIPGRMYSYIAIKTL